MTAHGDIIRSHEVFPVHGLREATKDGAETKSLQTIARFGPVGMGIDLIQPAFTMRIKNIEEGSSASPASRNRSKAEIDCPQGSLQFGHSRSHLSLA